VSEAAREGRLRTTEVAMTDAIKRWAMFHPDELVALQRQVRFIRDTLANGNAMSQDGHTLHKGQVPTSLWHQLQREIDRDWLHNHELRNMFWRIFKVGCINAHSETKDKWNL
jgi:hypothetical protein